MKTSRKTSNNIMKKYYQLFLIVACFISIVTLLIYRHEYYRLRYVLEVLNIFGKPGISEIEFCGPGYNATLLSEIVRNSSMDVRETPPLFQQIDDNFYSYSSFLRSYQKYDKLSPTHSHYIDTIVVGKLNVKPDFRCNIWLDKADKPKAGRFTYKMIYDPTDNYQLYIFHCSMNKNLGKPVAVSFYINDYNINPIHATINKVIQVNTKRKIRESSNIKFVNNIELGVCVIPNQVPMLTKDAFIEFLVFHHLMGLNYFTIYDSLVTEDIIRRLKMIPNDISQWQLQFFPLNFPFVFAKSYEIVRNAVEIDCLYRHFRIDKELTNKISHVVVMSWDEFIVPRLHINIKAVLDDSDPTRKARTTIVKSLLFCLNQNDDDNVEVAYPQIMKKTHYYTIQEKIKSIQIRNLDSMSSFEDIFNLNKSSNIVPLDILGIHKYTECRDPKTYHPYGNGYNETQMQVFQHKFEGAMLKYGQSLVNNKIYRMYNTGQIWENPEDKIRDLL